MKRSMLIAGIGNIFQGDDAFGVEVARELAKLEFPDDVRLMDAGIRGMDLAFALLEEYECIVLVDATARGGAPGTLYTIEIDPGDMAEAPPANAHSLDPVRVLALAKSMGAQFRKVLLVGCEPLVLDCDESGYIGLSEPVAAAVEPAVQTIRDLLEGGALAPHLAETEGVHMKVLTIASIAAALAAAAAVALNWADLKRYIKIESM